MILGDIKKYKRINMAGQIADNSRSFLVEGFCYYSLILQMSPTDQANQINHNFDFRFKKPGSVAVVDIRYLLLDDKAGKVKKSASSDLKLSLVSKICMSAKSGDTDCKGMISVKCINLSDNADIEIEPILKIEEQNVEVEHSVAVGGFDKNEKLYLSSRGFSKEQTENILKKAFLRSLSVE